MPASEATPLDRVAERSARWLSDRRSRRSLIGRVGDRLLTLVPPPTSPTAEAAAEPQSADVWVPFAPATVANGTQTHAPPAAGPPAADPADPADVWVPIAPATVSNGTQTADDSAEIPERHARTPWRTAASRWFARTGKAPADENAVPGDRPAPPDPGGGTDVTSPALPADAFPLEAQPAPPAPDPPPPLPPPTNHAAEAPTGSARRAQDAAEEASTPPTRPMPAPGPGDAGHASVDTALATTEGDPTPGAGEPIAEVDDADPAASAVAPEPVAAPAALAPNRLAGLDGPKSAAADPEDPAPLVGSAPAPAPAPADPSAVAVATAQAVSRARFSVADAVVLARADALVLAIAAPVAAALAAPLLVVDDAGNLGPVLAEIQRLGAHTRYAVGITFPDAEPVCDPDVADDLADLSVAAAQFVRARTGTVRAFAISDSEEGRRVAGVVGASAAVRRFPVMVGSHAAARGAKEGDRRAAVTYLVGADTIASAKGVPGGFPLPAPTVEATAARLAQLLKADRAVGIVDAAAHVMSDTDPLVVAALAACGGPVLYSLPDPPPAHVFTPATD